MGKIKKKESLGNRQRQTDIRSTLNLECFRLEKCTVPPNCAAIPSEHFKITAMASSGMLSSQAPARQFLVLQLHPLANPPQRHKRYSLPKALLACLLAPETAEDSRAHRRMLSVYPSCFSPSPSKEHSTVGCQWISSCINFEHVPVTRSTSNTTQ